MTHEWGTAPDFVGPRHALRERLLLNLFLAQRPGRRVLNAGAGQGSFSRLLEERGFVVVSTDSSPAAVAVLAERVAGETQQADVTALPFADERFDAVVLGEVIEHVEDDEAALAEARRVLRPDGVLTLSVPAGPGRMGPSDRWAGHVRRYDRTSLATRCEAAGFTVVRCVGWGFPLSALYHRHIYERQLERRGAGPPQSRERPALALLGAVLQVDRLFVGVERGALGLLLAARRR
jgi:SAM-dependent methyltransferase